MQISKNSLSLPSTPSKSDNPDSNSVNLTLKINNNNIFFSSNEEKDTVELCSTFQNITVKNVKIVDNISTTSGNIKAENVESITTSSSESGNINLTNIKSIEDIKTQAFVNLNQVCAKKVQCKKLELLESSIQNLEMFLDIGKNNLIIPKNSSVNTITFRLQEHLNTTSINQGISIVGNGNIVDGAIVSNNTVIVKRASKRRKIMSDILVNITIGNKESLKKYLLKKVLNVK